MAKKKTTRKKVARKKTSKKSAVVPQPAPEIVDAVVGEIVISGSLGRSEDADLKDAEDVSIVLVAKAERMIKGEIAGCKVIAKKLENEASELAKVLDKQLEQLAVDHYADTAVTCKETATALKFSKVGVETSTDSVCDTEARVSLVVRSENGGLSITIHKRIKLSAAIKKTKAAGVKLGKDVEANERAWLSWKRKYADMPSLERQGRAVAAERRLTRTDDGAALLEMTENSLHSHVKLLGQ